MATLSREGGLGQCSISWLLGMVSHEHLSTSVVLKSSKILTCLLCNLAAALSVLCPCPNLPSYFLRVHFQEIK